MIAENIILIELLFALVYLIMKRFAMRIWDKDKYQFLYIRFWYHWFEYIYIFIAAVLAPKHTIQQGMLTLGAVVILKIIVDKTKVLDTLVNKGLPE